MNDLSPHPGLEPQIRNAVRAVILCDDAILMQKKWSQTKGTWYTLPGGGQDVEETLDAALIRECEEEIGVRVVVDELLSVADFFKRRETDFPSTRHVMEFYFACRVPEDYRPTSGPHLDKHQIDVVWLPLEQLSQQPLFPPDLSHRLAPIIAGEQRGYLGEIA
jgi:ADP-ribose pyrophosphatase YjhB (NUDIX family)